MDDFGWLQFLLVLFFIVGTASATELPDLTQVADEQWNDACIQTRSELEEQSYSNLQASNTLQLNKIGSTEVDAFGMKLASPFRIQSIRSRADSTMGDLLIKGSDSQYIFAEIAASPKFLRLLTSSIYTDFVKKSFGAALTFSRLMYEAIQLTPDDVTCLLDDKHEGIWQLAVIREKSLLKSRSRSIKRAYLVLDDSWSGYATCFERGAYMFLDIDVESGDRNIMLIIKAIGSCEELDDHSSEKLSD